MLQRRVGKTTNLTNPVAAKHTPAANTDAVITVAATSAKACTLHGIQWSYSVAPTGGRLTVAVDGTTVFDVDITAAGPGGFNCTIAGGNNKAVVVTLAAGSGSCVGKLNIQYTLE